MLGRLSWAAIPFDVPVVMIAAGSVGFVIFCVLALVTVKGWWPYVWREWITSVDHKRIGVMYIGSGAPDAGARFLGRHVDAQSTGLCRRSCTRDICRPNITIRSFPRTAPS